VPKKIRQLTVRDGKIIVYDGLEQQFFLAKLEPLDIAALEKDELLEVVKLVLGDTGPGAVFEAGAIQWAD
jgi:hypothetical protein